MTSRRSPTRFSAALALLVALLAAACRLDLPSAPEGPDSIAQPVPASDGADDSKLGGLYSSPRLFACETPDFGSVTQQVGPTGGRIEIGPHALIIPRGALRRSVEITASAPAGPHVRVTLRPHGLKFRSRVTLVLSYRHCTSVGPRRPKIAHVDELQDSILDLLPSKHSSFKKSVSTSLSHFSGYAIAD
jgi:hypothetical protein